MPLGPAQYYNADSQTGSPTDLAGLTGLHLSSPSSTVDLNEIYNLHYSPQSTVSASAESRADQQAESRPVSLMQDQESMQYGIQSPYKPNIRDNTGGINWPNFSDDSDDTDDRGVTFPSLSRSDRTRYLPVSSVGKRPIFHAPSSAVQLSSSVSVYPEPHQSLFANDAHHDYVPGIATAYYSEPNSDKECYKDLVTIPDPERSFRGPWADGRSTLYSAVRTGGGWIASIARRTARGAKGVFDSHTDLE